MAEDWLKFELTPVKWPKILLATEIPARCEQRSPGMQDLT